MDCVCVQSYITLLAHFIGLYHILDYGNTQLTNKIPSLEITVFVGYLFRGNYFAALWNFSWRHGNHFFNSRYAVRGEG